MIGTRPQPLYARIQRMLIERIRTSHKPGDLLPTQKELARETGASLITVKRALDEIARLGLVESTQGRGTVVRKPAVTDARHGVSSWTDSVYEVGETPQTAWTNIEVRVPPLHVRHQLKLGARKKTVRIRRLRLVRGEPVSLMTNELVHSVVPGLESRGLSHESLYACLRARYGIVPCSASEHVTARLSTAEERKFLGDDVKVVLEVERVTRSKDGKPFEVSTTINNANTYRYQVDLR